MAARKTSSAIFSCRAKRANHRVLKTFMGLPNTMNYSTYSWFFVVAAWILSQIPTGAVHSGHFLSAMSCYGYSEFNDIPAEPRQFDVIVLGAGAAGLMCA